MAYMTDENGNYKRTVRCGHCYEKGHNKSACPKRKQDLLDNVERYTKELAEENWAADDWQRKNCERYLSHSKQQLEKMASRGKGRKCGFCGEQGHTRRTCTHRKQKVEEETTKTIRLRKESAKRMIAAGFGPGTLVKATTYNSNVARLAVVTNVKIGNLFPGNQVSRTVYFHGAQCVEVQWVAPVEDNWGGRPQVRTSCYLPLNFANIDDIPEHEWYRNPQNNSCEVVSTADVSEDDLYKYSDVEWDVVSKQVLEEIVDPK